MRLDAPTPEEYDRWHTEVQQRFADLPAGTGTMTATDAADRAVGVFARLLPLGLQTPQHHIRHLVEDDEIVGDLWLHVDAPTDGTDDTNGTESTGTDGFLYDIRLTPEALARGLGPAAMELAEQSARDLGATVVGVNVFTADADTRGLVEGRGYEPTANRWSCASTAPRRRPMTSPPTRRRSSCG